MRHTISASNAGAHRLTAGDCDRSVEYLSAAFEQSRQAVLQEATRRNALDETSPDAPRMHGDCGFIDTWMTEAPEEVDLESPYIYSSPIFIPPTADHNDHVLVSVVVAFNLGLAFLAMAKRDNADPSNRTLRLHQALKLFQYSFRLQRARGKASQSPLFFMATVNNIGVLYSTMGQADRANECFQQLLALLMYMNTNAMGLVSKYSAFLQNTTRISAGNGHACCAVRAAGAA